MSEEHETETQVPEEVVEEVAVEEEASVEEEAAVEEEAEVMSSEEVVVDRFKSRVKELRNVPAKELLANPKNWRLHTEDQELILRDVLDKVGFCDALLARETEDGELLLIDGHLRKDLAENEEVPVLVLDITEEEADYVLATYDGITNLAYADEDKLQSLIEGLSDNAEKITTGVLYGDEYPDLEVWDSVDFEAGGYVDTYKDESEPGVDVAPDELVDRVMSEEDLEAEEEKLTHIWEKIYDSSLPYGMPPIDISMCAELPPHGVSAFMGYNSDTDYLNDEEQWWLLLYGREPKSKQALLPVERTILGFYVDDWRFEGMWTNPVPSLARLKNFGLQYAITPNYSLYAEFPMAVQLFNVYRSRWVGCAMQDAGIKVIPDIQWSDQQSYEYCFLGVPVGCPCVSIQFQTRSGVDENYSRMEGLQALMEAVEPQSLLIYGGESEDIETIRKEFNLPVTYIESRWDRISQGDA